MTAIGKITAKGQTTIPAEIRAALGVGVGDRVEYVTEADGKIVLRKARSGLESLMGLIKTDRPYSTDEIVAMVRNLRDGTGWLDDRN
ncbi:MAG: type II toxin-antitoxin system PrlF family antitoxin [Pseudorhodobacter sp.]|nr:type II toxin-antitoxin system PrlF family antitoxin [Pseudorhodobacter sp.]